MRLPSFLRRPEPEPFSPEMQDLQDRARDLRWQVIFQRGPSPESAELDRVNALIVALRLEEEHAAAL
jgi:hypothetical protein